MLKKIIASFLLLALAFPATGSAQDSNLEFPFREFFDDGDERDGSPGTWTPDVNAAGTQDASSGDLVLSISGDGRMNTWIEEFEGAETGGFSARGEFTETAEKGSYFAILARARGDGESLSAYAAGIRSDGTMFIDHIDNGVSRTLTSKMTHFRPADGLSPVFRFGMYKQHLRLDLDLGRFCITVRDSSLADGGRMGLSAGSVSGSGTSVVRATYFGVLPEPSTNALALIACFAHLGFRRRK